MEIRPATSLDLTRIVELGRRALVDGPYAGVLADNPAQAAKLAAMILANGTILLAIADSHICGMLGFITTKHHVSGALYSTELIWYVEPEYRHLHSFFDGPAFDLMREAERRSAEAGAEFIAFTAPTENIGAVYRRVGYKPLEVVYWKQLRGSVSQPLPAQ
jgi:hypothetical protein